MRTATDKLKGLRDERGFTLVELLIGMVVTLAVLTAALPVLERAVKNERGVRETAARVGEARTFTEQVLRDLRPADATPGFNGNSPNPTTFSVNTYVRHTACGNRTPLPASEPPTRCRVTYACSGGICTRQEGAPGSTGGTAVRVIDGLSSNNIFSYTQVGDHRVTFVGVTAIFPNPTISGDDAITLQDGTALRNLE